MLHFYRLPKWGWGLEQLYTGMDGDVDSCLQRWMEIGTVSKLVAWIGVGMGIRVVGTSGIGINICPCAAHFTVMISVLLSLNFSWPKDNRIFLPVDHFVGRIMPAFLVKLA